MPSSATPSEGVNSANPRRSTPYSHSARVPPPNSYLRTPSKGVPQMHIFPTPSESNGVLESKGRELNIVGEERCLLSF